MFLFGNSRRSTFMSVIGLFLLVLLIFSAYSNTFHSPPVVDDIHSFVDEPLVQHFDWSFTSVKSLAGSKFGLLRFLPMLSLAHDFWRGKGGVVAFHVTNLIIHIFATMAVFFWVRTLLGLGLRGEKRQDDFFGLFTAFAVAGIWALVPIQTNAVTYLVQRMASLAALFYIVSFTAYFNGRKKWLLGFRGKAKLSWLLSFMAAIAAFMSKENTFTLPVMILVGEWLFYRQQLYDHLKSHKKFYFLLSIVLSGLLLIAAIKIYPSILEGYKTRNFTLSERLLTECRVVVSYISLLLIPLPSRLCLDYHVAISQSLLNPVTTLFSFLFLVSILVLGWCWRRKYSLVSFLIFWFFINLVIESSFIALELKFEHRLYLPSTGFYFILVLGVGHFASAFPRLCDRRLGMALVALICSMLSLMTYNRNQTWSDGITINLDCVSKAYLKPRVHSNLSGAYVRAGFYDKAIAESEKAIDLGVFGYEEYWVSANNIVTAYVKLGDNEKACHEGEILLANAPAGAKLNALPIFYRNLAWCYLQVNNFQAAFGTIILAIDFNARSSHPVALDTEGVLHSILERATLYGDDKDVGALGLKGRNTESVFVRMTDYFLNLSDLQKALIYSQKALSINPESQICKINLKKIEMMDEENTRQLSYGTFKSNYLYRFWHNSFNLAMAIAYVIEKNGLPFNYIVNNCLEYAKTKRPECADVWLLSSWHYYRLGDYCKAIKEIDKALKIDISYAQLWVNFGMYQLAQGNPVEARQVLLKALELYPGYPKRSEVLAVLAAAQEMIDIKSCEKNAGGKGEENGAHL